jgi:hypothetical protein
VCCGASLTALISEFSNNFFWGLRRQRGRGWPFTWIGVRGVWTQFCSDMSPDIRRPPPGVSLYNITLQVYGSQPAYTTFDAISSVQIESLLRQISNRTQANNRPGSTTYSLGLTGSSTTQGICRIEGLSEIEIGFPCFVAVESSNLLCLFNFKQKQSWFGLKVLQQNTHPFVCQLCMGQCDTDGLMCPFTSNSTSLTRLKMLAKSRPENEASSASSTLHQVYT